MSLAVDLDHNPSTRRDLSPLVATEEAESGTTIGAII